jgi:porphobilinogen deaminase
VDSELPPGVTVRADRTELLKLLAEIDGAEGRVVATAERATELYRSCRTPTGNHVRLTNHSGPLTIAATILAQRETVIMSSRKVPAFTVGPGGR